MKSNRLSSEPSFGKHFHTPNVPDENGLALRGHDMKTGVEHSLPLLLLVCSGFLATAQVVIPSGSLPHTVGEYSVSYVRTNTDISALIGTTGSNYWDFSQPQAKEDVIGRMDIVPVSDMGYGVAFPGATFAERFTGGLISGRSWEYYDLNGATGFVFYGTYDPVGYGANPSIPANPPAPLLPPAVYYGESWTNGYAFDVTDPLFGDIPATYQSSGTIDAYGILRLPGFGEVPALRVTQVENYYEAGIPFQSDTNWQWLAPGIGYAAQVVSYAPNAIAPGSQPYTNSFSRAFFYPPSTPSPTLRLMLESNVAALAWASTSNAGGYVLQTSTNLNLTNWLPVALLTNQSLSVPIITGSSQQFFRVIVQP